MVIATLELARATPRGRLSFLGLGIQPPTPSWGGMTARGREYLDSAWRISTFPGLVLMLTSLVVAHGDRLRDLLDPTLREKRHGRRVKHGRRLQRCVRRLPEPRTVSLDVAHSFRRSLAASWNVPDWRLLTAAMSRLICLLAVVARSTYRSTPRVRPAGTASHLGLFDQPAEFRGCCAPIGIAVVGPLGE